MTMMKGDGKGNLVIPGWFLTIMLILLTILSSVASVVAMGTTLRNDVDHLQEQWNIAGPQHTETIKDIDERLKVCENTNTAINTKLDNIEKVMDSMDSKLDSLYEGLS